VWLLVVNFAKVSLCVVRVVMLYCFVVSSADVTH
jgi:hypothetical protein